MSGKTLLVGIAIGGSIALYLTHRPERFEEVQTIIAETFSEPTDPSSSEEAVAVTAPETAQKMPAMMPLQTAMDFPTPYGRARVPVGTHLLALRETERGILVQFAGRDVVVPAGAFKAPPPPSFPVVPPAASAPPPPARPSQPPSIAELPGPPAATPPPTKPAEAAKVVETSKAETKPKTIKTSAGSARYLVLVDGAEGKGSASIISIKGKPSIITNAHVVSGNRSLKFRLLNSREIKVEKLGFSTTADLAIADQSEVTGGLPMLEDVGNNVAVDDEVVVLGNSQGSDVITEIPGKVVGIGPELIEVDAPFVAGNSGSPIIHAKTGKVIGIATYVTLRNTSVLEKDTRFAEIRRFGYRLDVATEWEFPPLHRFVAESALIQQSERVTDALIEVILDIQDDGRIALGPHQARDNPARPHITEFLRAMTNSRSTATADIIEAKQKLFRALLHMTNSGELNTAGFTRWHQRRAAENARMRHRLNDRFTAMANYQDASRQINLP